VLDVPPRLWYRWKHGKELPMAHFGGKYQETFTVDFPIEKAKEHWGDLDQIASCYGQLDHYEHIEDMTLLFTLEPKEALGGRVSFLGKYDCKYSWDRDNKFSWKTVGPKPNVFSTGSIIFTKVGENKTRLVYDQTTEMEIKINRLLGKAISPIVKREVISGIKSYLSCMRKAMK